MRARVFVHEYNYFKGNSSDIWKECRVQCEEIIRCS